MSLAKQLVQQMSNCATKCQCSSCRHPHWSLKEGTGVGGTSLPEHYTAHKASHLHLLKSNSENFFKIFFRERETLICRFTHLCIHRLPPVCALSGHRTHNLVYTDTAVTNRAPRPGLSPLLISPGDDVNQLHLFSTLGGHACATRASDLINACATGPCCLEGGGLRL